MECNIPSLEDIINTYYKFIFNICIKYLSNVHDAEDVTHEVIIKIITNIQSYKSKSKISTWIYAIARNQSLNYLSSNKKKQEYSYGIDTFIKSSQTPEIEDDEAFQIKLGIIQALLSALNPDERKIFILSRIFGINSAEGAELFDITPEAYRKRLSRIHQKLDNYKYANCTKDDESAFGIKCKDNLYSKEIVEINEKLNEMAVETHAVAIKTILKHDFFALLG